MTGDCVSCDTRNELTEAGLCQRCRDGLRFVVRPAAHREGYRRRVAGEADLMADVEELGVVVVASYPDDNSVWICDLCNSQIPVDGEFTLIPLIGTYAICMSCATTLDYWPDGWTEPAPRACRCGACQRPLLSALART